MGVPADWLALLTPAVGALQTAEARWFSVRSPAKEGDAQAILARAQAFRDDALAAARRSLRNDRVAMATCRAIAEGDDQADLVQDHLAALIESRRPAFVGDATFDAEAAPAAARKASTELLATMSDASRREARVAAKVLRDRANTSWPSRSARFARPASRHRVGRASLWRVRPTLSSWSRSRSVSVRKPRASASWRPAWSSRDSPRAMR